MIKRVFYRHSSVLAGAENLCRRDKLNIRRAITVGGILLGSFLIAMPKPAHGAVVTAVLCTGADFFCNQPGDVVVDSGIRSNGINVLASNTFSVMNFNFNDPLVNFNGRVVVADRAGQFIYSWGTGTATAFDPLLNGASGGIGLFLDVTISQNYLTVPGLWGFKEINVGNCNLPAALNGSTSLVQGAVNSSLMPVLGAVGDCAVAPFAFGAGPFAKTVGLVTNMTAAAQFFFAPGAAGNQQITLPWGDDFPDPTLNFNDPNNPDNFVTDVDNAGFADAPEPASFSLIGGALCVAGFCLRRRKA
jgi:hypothetical protein